jgi:hypothetical protein
MWNTIYKKLSMPIKNNLSDFCFSLFIITVFVLINISSTFSASDKWYVSLRVNPMHVTIWSSWDISLPTISPSFDTGEIQATFSPNSFWLDDRKTSNSWYITTIQSSDLVFNNWTEDIRISSNNVFLKTSSAVSVIYGLPNPRVTFGSSINNVRWNIWTPVVYFKRDLAENFWIIWRYWDTPSIKIIIPPAQAPWTYIWTIYYTLISW